MPRRYRRRRYAIARPVKTAKYSNETFCADIDVPIRTSTTSEAKVVTPATAVNGTRKCKNFTVTLGGSVAFVWALVYVPEGTSPSALKVGAHDATGAVSFYEPNQNVILSGMYAGPSSQRFKTRLARNLNSNDAIYVIVHALDTTAGSATFMVNYAISY